MAAMCDINPVKLASEKLRQSRDTYEDFFHNASDMIFVHDLGNLISVNPAAERITGYSVAELVRMNIQELADNESLDLRGFQYSAWALAGISTTSSRLLPSGNQIYLDVNIWPVMPMGKLSPYRV